MKKLLDKVLVYEDGQEPEFSDYCWLAAPYVVGFGAILLCTVII